MQSLFHHTLFETWVARCSPNSDLGRSHKRLGTAGLAILSKAVEVFLKIH